MKFLGLCNNLEVLEFKPPVITIKFLYSKTSHVTMLLLYKFNIHGQVLFRFIKVQNKVNFCQK